MRHYYDLSRLCGVEEIQSYVGTGAYLRRIDGFDTFRWAPAFFSIVALIAALCNFGGIAAAAAGTAKFIFYLFLVLFLVSLWRRSL